MSTGHFESPRRHAHKRRRPGNPLLTAVTLWIACGGALDISAQPTDAFSIGLFEIDGGGGYSSGQRYSLAGVIRPYGGQMTGGVFAVNGSMRLLPSVPALPLDGTIVYCRFNPNSGATTIWFASLNGGSDQFVTTGWMAHLSRDRRYLVFLRDGPNGNAYGSRGDLWVRDLATGLEAKLYTDSDYIVSADFTLDAALVLFDFGCADFSIPRDGSANGNSTWLSGGSCYDDAPAVNPVDGRVAYHNNGGGGGICIATTNFQNKTLVPNSALGTYPLWSHDGQWLSYTLTSGYYTYSGYDLYKIHPDGTGQTRLTFLTGPTNHFSFGAAWASGDDALIGAATINGTNGLYRVAADGSGAISLLNIIQPGDPVAYVSTVTGSAAPPQLGVGLSTASGTLTISWPALDAVLEFAPAASGPWAPVPGATNPLVVTPRDPRGFFRLRRP